MNHTMKLNKSQVRDILKATFPEYRGRTFRIEFTPTVSFYNTNWSGGTRNIYVAVWSDGRTAKFNAPAPWVNVIEGQTIDMPQNVLIVEHTIFCGKDLGITIYAHPVHLPKWLPRGENV